MTERRRCYCRKGPAVVRMHQHWWVCLRCARKMGARARPALARYEASKNPSGFTPELLKKIAAGPIMDSNEIYLPAGKISLEAARQRELAGLEVLRDD